MSRSSDVQLVGISVPSEAKAAAVFIHGIAGHYLDSWGEKNCPATFLRRLSVDCPSVAVFSADYPSGMDRLVDDDDLTLRRLVEGWANVLGESVMNHYRAVAVIGFCLGGLLTTMAIRQWFVNDAKWAQCLASGDGRLMLFLLDTLHQVPNKEDHKEGLVGMRSAFQCGAEEFQENVNFWRGLMKQEFPRERLPVDAFALLSEGESFVKSWSPHAHLPSHRVHQTKVSHEHLVRPPTGGAFFPYDFVASKIRQFTV